MVTGDWTAIDARAAALARRLAESTHLRADVVDGVSTVGGGAAPDSALPTRLVALQAASISASTLAARLRAGDPPVISRIERDRVVLDLRTIAEDDDERLATAVMAVSS
jgi:L-seryl-tRNA(Ser) seleniumtransferase